MKKFLSILGASLFALGFVGCSNELENSNNLSALLLNNSNSSSQTGTFTYESQASRSISVDDIKSAIVTLTGYDSNGNKFSKSSSAVSVSSGKPSSSITVSDVPVANNVVVTVKAYSDEAGSVEIQGQTIRTVTNITSGSNSASADWTTTIKGNIYNALCEGGVNTNTGLSAYSSNIETLTEAYASANVHAALVDVDAILSVVKANGELSTSASSYRKTPASLTITSYGYEGKTILIRDPLSSSVTAPANGQTVTISNILPGCWGLYVDGSLLKNITLSSGENQAVIGDPLTGKVVIFAKTTYTNIYVWYHGTETALNGTWPGNVFTSSDCSSYMNDASGWKMLDITDTYNSSTGTIDFIITDSSGNKEYGDTDLESGKSATFWFDGENYYDSDPTQAALSNDATLASISVNGSALSGFASGTTSYSTEIASSVTSAAVTAVANDDGASLTVSPSASTEIEEGESKTFTITVLAEDGTTTMTYTVSVTRKETVVDDVSLSSVKVNGNAASLSGTTYSYTKTGSDESLTISSLVATPTDTSASVSYSTIPSTVASGSPASVTITVTNGSKSATYTLTISYTQKSSSGQYGTNDKGYGVNATISSWDDWTETMQIARGAAYDDPRTWKGHQEVPYDAYALYAAYDDTNLYLMVELTNIADGRASFMNHDYAGSDNAWWDNRDCPIGFIINTGTGSTQTAPTVYEDGSTGPIWGAINFTDSEGFDYLFYHSSKYGYADHKASFVGVGTPGLFKLNNSTGYFSYDSDYCLSANSGAPGSEVTGTSGISIRYIRQCQVTDTIYFESSPEDNRTTSAQTGDDLLASETYSSAETNDLDMSYWYTIPLSTLGITKSYIESNGIGVRQITPNGGSLMDCLPWDVSMVDVASEDCSDDASTSQEKEDVDNITSAQARIGHSK